MGTMSIFKATTRSNSPLNALEDDDKAAVSDFLTVQSFANFAAMTGGIIAAWNGLQKMWPEFAAIWVPYLLAAIWAVVSLLISIEGLKQKENGKEVLKPGTIAGAIFLAMLNSLVLAGAVVGTSIATSEAP